MRRSMFQETRNIFFFAENGNIYWSLIIQNGLKILNIC